MNGYFWIFGWYAPETKSFIFGVLRRVCVYIGICGIRQLRFWDFVILRRNRENNQKFSRYFNFSWSRPWRSWSRPWRSWSRPWRSWSRQGRSGSRPWRAWTRPWRALTRPCCVKSRPWRFLGAPGALQGAVGRAWGPLWASHRRRAWPSLSAVSRQHSAAFSFRNRHLAQFDSQKCRAFLKHLVSGAQKFKGRAQNLLRNFWDFCEIFRRAENSPGRARKI